MRTFRRTRVIYQPWCARAMVLTPVKVRSSPCSSPPVRGSGPPLTGAALHGPRWASGRRTSRPYDPDASGAGRTKDRDGIPVARHRGTSLRISRPGKGLPSTRTGLRCARSGPTLQRRRESAAKRRRAGVPAARPQACSQKIVYWIKPDGRLPSFPTQAVSGGSLVWGTKLQPPRVRAGHTRG